MNDQRMVLNILSADELFEAASWRPAEKRKSEL
jgi:hypothetical protein